jgi:hypothetical protein
MLAADATFVVDAGPRTTPRPSPKRLPNSGKLLELVP